MLSSLSIASLALLSALASAQTACNNSPSLCSRAYSNLTHLGAHNSPFVRDASTSFSVSGNHFYNSTVQLDAGVRLLSAQVHNRNANGGGTPTWHLCHSSCDLLDAGPLSSWLGEVKTWMDAHPNDVVTLLLVNADGATASDLHAQFTAADIVRYGYVPAAPGPTTQWPTLESLIAANTRLITFVASRLPAEADTVAPYLLDEFTYVFETPFDNTAPSNFTCLPDRPAALAGDPATAIASGRLPLMNHFLYETQAFFDVPAVDNVTTTNAVEGVGSLGEHGMRCTGVWGRVPSFVLVDFFNVGPAIESVDRLNGVTSPVGRRNVGDEVVMSGGQQDAQSAAVGRAGVSWAVVVLAAVVSMLV
ncbi:hypothetical protein H2201_007486 [Coniosporium apollinis]|uniref:Phosphatidylinositol-specific phospholipase C X domain-containing protein n=2 Tax=Coniosporium TaxID=2810619 RepID=A0ABQ9NJ34_9PEZI|nr:hypothetical protein H2199_002738 [Cladosporium sp. JES 115]KAJ9659084.1 hypothetical protein H2201_007486 [Coniosporium apollinis]